MTLVKNKILFLFSVALILLLLANCRRDPQISKPGSQVGPDSLYQGTKYTITPPFQFPKLSNPYKDSLTVEGIYLGRRLFYDKHLSINGQLSCASCHILQHGLADSIALATNVSGPNTRNALALVNLAWAPYFFWDGRQPTIAAAAQDAFHNELGLNVMGAISYLQSDSTYSRLFKKAFGRPGTVTERSIYLGIQEFLMTVISGNSRFDSVMRGQAIFTAGEADGFYNLFSSNIGECYHCHAQGATFLLVNYDEGSATFRNTGYVATNTYDGFADPGRGGITGLRADSGLFKNPTLRNIAVTGPYMHDGGYKTLEQVINFYSDSLRFSPTVDQFVLIHMTQDSLGNYHGGFHFSATQKAELLQVLNDFTDYPFLNDTSYSNPFPH